MAKIKPRQHGDKASDRLGVGGRPGSRQAKKLRRRLKQEDFRRRVGFTDDQILMLDKIAEGRPPRNAMAIMQALKLKADFAYSRPKIPIEVDDKRDVAGLLRAARERQRRIAIEEDGEVDES